MNRPPVAGVSGEAFPVMDGLVFDGLEPSLMSAAVIVFVELTVLRTTLKLAVPDASGASKGETAFGSLELMPFTSVPVLTGVQNASTALTVTLKGWPAVRAVGVPVLPLAVPGAGVSPGTRSCNFVKAPGPTAMLPEVTLVAPAAVKLMVIVSTVL